MSHITQTLKRIDDEITACRQQIATLQISIVRLEDSRRVFLGLEEADEAARQEAALERHHADQINGQHAKPMITVRKTTAAPLGIVQKGRRKGLPRLRPGSAGRKRRNVKNDIVERILKALQPGDAPISPKALGNSIGLPPGDDGRKPFWNALYGMKARGQLERNAEGQYYRPTPQ